MAIQGGMESIEYRGRATLWSPEQHYVLERDALVLTETQISRGKPVGEPVTTRIPLSSIARLRLIYAPGRLESNRFECEIILRGSGLPPKLRIISFHFRGLADFVDQAATYTPFVRALCERTAAQNPSLSILAGYTPAAYYAGLTVLLLFIAAFGTFVVIEWERLFRIPRAPFRLSLLAGLLLVLLFIYRRNRPRALVATAPPDDLLPKIKA